MPAVQQLSGTIVVIIIAVGVQACIILFIFAKRQIQRFALRNRRGPHMSIVHGGPKSLRREADKLLDYVQYIKHEPILESLQPDSEDYRRLLIISFQSFEFELASYSQYFIRPPCANVRAHMLSCTHGPLVGVDTRVVHQVCDDYNNARHHYEEIDLQKYQAFLARLSSLRDSLRANKIAKPHPSPLPPPKSFSDSPRKRRGRGHTSLAVTTTGVNNTAGVKRNSTSSSKRHGTANKTVAYDAPNSSDHKNLLSGRVGVACENSSYSPPESMSSIPSTRVVDSNERIEPRSTEINSSNLTTGVSGSHHSAAIGSIVSVENTQNRKKHGSPKRVAV